MKHAILTLALTALALTSVSCDGNYLTREPPGQQRVENFYQTPEDALAAVNAAYAAMQLTPFNSQNYWRLSEIPSDDDILFNNTGEEFDEFTWNSTSSHLEAVWSVTYNGVIRANRVLAAVPNIEMDNEDLKARYLAEAKFLRALYYWHLTTMWQDVPLLTDVPATPQEAEVPKSAQSEVYDLMIQDLQEAERVLPQTYGSSDVGRATQGAAQALLGKVHLYAENYQEAEQWLGQIVESGAYELQVPYAEVFTTDNGPGSVFEIQYADVGGPTPGSDGPGVNESTHRSWYWLPRGGFANVLPTEEIVGAYEEDDPRLSASIWRQGDYYDEQEPTYESDWTATGYAVKKGLTPVQRGDAEIGTNFALIRFADVLLMYAEAANENGNLAAALEAVNRVRERVDMPPLPTEAYPAGTQQELFDAIVHERRVELAFEFHRYNDLRRWGLAQQELGPLGYEPRHRYYPIPQAELDVNENLEQNPDY